MNEEITEFVRECIDEVFGDSLGTLAGPRDASRLLQAFEDRGLTLHETPETNDIGTTPIAVNICVDPTQFTADELGEYLRQLGS